MGAELYQESLAITMALVILMVAFITVKESWKQGNFVAISLSVSLIFLSLSALVEQATGLMNISMILLFIATAIFLFTVFVVAPMSFRRSRKRRTPPTK